MGSKWRQILLGDLIQQGQAVLQTGPFGALFHLRVGECFHAAK